jgi:hypothetical protein
MNYPVSDFQLETLVMLMEDRNALPEIDWLRNRLDVPLPAAIAETCDLVSRGWVRVFGAEKDEPEWDAPTSTTFIRTDTEANWYRHTGKGAPLVGITHLGQD